MFTGDVDGLDAVVSDEQPAPKPVNRMKSAEAIVCLKFMVFLYGRWKEKWCAIVCSEFRDDGFQLFFGLAEFYLQSPHQFFLFPFAEEQIVIGECCELLFQFPGDLVPIPFDIERIHGFSFNKVMMVIKMRIPDQR
jgi:hypothetical protein